jgi:hypothetical protein
MQSSPLPCYLIPLGPKYPPQHLILENPQPTFLLQGMDAWRRENVLFLPVIVPCIIQSAA